MSQALLRAAPHSLPRAKKVLLPSPGGEGERGRGGKGGEGEREGGGEGGGLRTGRQQGR